jgi:hypothetical protein
VAGHCWKTSVAVILASTGAGLVDSDSGKLWQKRFQLVPDPLGEDLAGRIFQAWDVIQVVVIKALIQRFEDRLDLGKVTNPASVRIYITGQMNTDLKGVTVQAAALVALRNMRQPVRRLKRKLFENIHEVYALK